MRSHNSGSAYSITILATPTLIKAIDRALEIDPRIALAIANESAQTVYIGYDTNLTVANGYPVTSGGRETETGYHGNIYGIVASDTAEIRVRYY